MHANEAQRLLAFCEHPPKWISGVAVEPDPEAIDKIGRAHV